VISLSRRQFNILELQISEDYDSIKGVFVYTVGDQENVFFLSSFSQKYLKLLDKKLTLKPVKM
jgi:hypothetical protein